jgi:hypothetical protein
VDKAAGRRLQPFVVRYRRYIMSQKQEYAGKNVFFFCNCVGTFAGVCVCEYALDCGSTYCRDNGA